MKTAPIAPARIVFGEAADEPPQAPEFGDVYHPRIGAAAQAQHVFLQGNGLPGRWAGRDHFTIFESGFGLGHNFLATWQAWRDDARRCRMLHYVAIDKHPPRREDLQRIHGAGSPDEPARRLMDAWPPLTPNLHALAFDGGRVRLLLGWGDIAALLPAMRFSADAFFLDGFAPARNPQMWQPRVLAALGRKAAEGATVATWSAARALRDGLTTAGFETERQPGIGGKRDITVGRFAPRHRPRNLPHAAVAGRSAIVIGAGLAGAATARALADLGWSVIVLDRHGQAASEASGNAAGLFHGIVSADDGRYARLYRTASQCAARDFASAMAAGVPGAFGLLRLQDADGDIDAMRALLKRQQLPADWVQAWTADEASMHAGVTLSSPAWWYPTGGWISPAAWVRQVLAHPAITRVAHAEVASIARAGGQWQARDHQGRTLAQAPALVLANAAGAATLLQRCVGSMAASIGPDSAPPWPLSHTRGQISLWPGDSALRMAVAGDGYAIPLSGGVWCGATRQVRQPAGDDSDRAVSGDDRESNLLQLQRLLGRAVNAIAPDKGIDLGRTERAGWRLHADDRMPIAGAVPGLSLGSEDTSTLRMDQARLLPREPGLFVITALGSRGLTLAPLLGRLVAAQAAGLPWPLEQDLADSVDPGRWRVRAARQAQRAGQGEDQAAEEG